MHREEGSATIVVACVAMLAIFVLTAVAGVGRIAVTRARVSAAADLAALAGAAGGGGCEVAQTTARANGVHLSDCRAEGADLWVVAIDDVRLAGRTIVVRAQARAGPGVGRQDSTVGIWQSERHATAGDQ